MTVRHLERKLASIAAGRYTPDDFVIADAKDADMAFGVTAPGPRPGVSGRYRSRQDYLADMRAQVRQGDIDILLTSASNGDWLTDEGALRLERVLTNDPGTGVMRHADAGYPLARETARERGIDLPMLP